MPNPTPTGVRRFGRYELLVELARGGMAELWLARLRGIGGFSKLVAIKRILPHLAQDKLFAEMFLNEGRIAAQLSHPNVCQVHEIGDADGDLFLAMEYLEGAAWNDIVSQLPRDNATLRLTVGVLAQACEGLHYAHDLHDLEGNATPIVHRDVSPPNIFVTQDGRTKVLDFGIAKHTKDSSKTRTGVLKGKLPYMSPEQIQAEGVDARTDVWALGVVFWEALTGLSLFDRDSDFLVWKAITEVEPPSLTQYGYSREVDLVVKGALARNRDQRFATTRHLAAAMRQAAHSVGGAYEPAEISEVVRSVCGDQLRERQRAVASVVTKRDSAERASAKPAQDFAAEETIEAQAASTVALRVDSVPVEREEEEKSGRWPWLLAALVVAGVAAAAFVVFSSSSFKEPKLEPAPAPVVAKTEPVVVVPPPKEEPPPQPVATEPVVDEPVLRSDPKKKKVTTPVVKKTAKVVAPVEPKVEPKVTEEPAPTGDPGYVAVDSTPYATIFDGAKSLGETPLRYKLAPGKHVLTARTQDGRTKKFTVVVESGKTASAGTLTW